MNSFSRHPVREFRHYSERFLCAGLALDVQTQWLEPHSRQPAYEPLWEAERRNGFNGVKQETPSARCDVLRDRRRAAQDEDIAPLGRDRLHDPVHAQPQVVQVVTEGNKTEGFSTRRGAAPEPICCVTVVLLSVGILDGVV